ncbi:MAG: hypothetical protein H5T61_09380 [Thermoflexales bacterium]|nr:hypothetical protein [Thermoflexales bacterium]
MHTIKRISVFTLFLTVPLLLVACTTSGYYYRGALIPTPVPALTLPSTPALTLIPTPSPPISALTPLSTPALTLTPTPLSLTEKQEISLIFLPNQTNIEGVTWNEYNGQFNVKDRLIKYSLLYPASWFVYPEDDGSIQIQNISREKALEQGRTNMGESDVKIAIEHGLPCEENDCPQFPNEESIVLSGLSGRAWVEYDEIFNLTIQTIILPLENHSGTLRVIIYVGGKPEDVSDRLKAMVDNLLFSIKIELH